MSDSSISSNECNVPPVDDPLGDIDESDVLANTIAGLQEQIERLTRERDDHKRDADHVRGVLRSAERDYKAQIERLRAALNDLADRAATKPLMRSEVVEICDRALSGDGSIVETSKQLAGSAANPSGPANQCPVGWLVGKWDESPALYNLHERERAFDAARRWGCSITPLVLGSVEETSATIDMGPTGTAEGLRRYIHEQLGFLAGEDDNKPAEKLLRIAAQRLRPAEKAGG